MPIKTRFTQRTTRIKLVTDGFIQYFESNFIEKIEWRGNSFKIGVSTIRVNNGKMLEVDEYDFHGICKIHFHGKSPKEYDTSVIRFDSLQGRTFGFPISSDGNKLFVTSPYDKIRNLKQGLHAYNIETGSLLWRLNKGNVGNVFVYDDYLVFINAYDSVYKVNINNGEVLSSVKNKAAERIFDLGAPYILVDAPVGKLSVIDTQKMLVVKKYNPKAVNPSDCLSLMIRDANLQDGKLTIYGIEQFPSGNYVPTLESAVDGEPFERVIDTDLHFNQHQAYP